MGGKVIERNQWADHPELWKGEFQGGAHGADVSVVFYVTDEIGGGPRLHRHPYAETFIIRTGRALFTLGDEKIEAKAGQILVAPAGMPHKFENLGPGGWSERLDFIDRDDAHSRALSRHLRLL